MASSRTFSAPHHVRRDLSVGDQPAVLAAAVELAHDSALLEQEVHTSQMIAVGRVEVGLTLGDRQLLAQHQHPAAGFADALGSAVELREDAVNALPSRVGWQRVRRSSNVSEVSPAAWSA